MEQMDLEFLKQLEMHMTVVFEASIVVDTEIGQLEHSHCNLIVVLEPQQVEM